MLMLIYVNQNNGENINCLKASLNIKNISINMKHLRNTKSNHPLTGNPSTRKPGGKTPHSTPTSTVNPKQVI